MSHPGQKSRRTYIVVTKDFVGGLLKVLRRTTSYSTLFLLLLLPPVQVDLHLATAGHVLSVPHIISRTIFALLTKYTWNLTEEEGGEKFSWC